VNNTELGDDNGDDDDHYWNNDDISSAVIQLEGFQHPSEVFVSHNHFSNPDATYELSVNFKSTFPSTTLIVDLGFNFWDRSNYSAVIQRYVLLFSIINLLYFFNVLY